MKKFVHTIILTALMLSVTIAVAACGEKPVTDVSPAPSASSPSTPAPSTPAPSTPTPTQSVPDVAYEITYNNARLFTSSIGTVWVQLIAEIENTGSKALYLSSGSYELEDADGSLIKTGSLMSVYPQVIEPGEKAYYYEETTVDNVSADTEVVLLMRPKAAKATVSNIRYNVTDVKITDTKYYGVEASGRVENTSGETDSMIEVAVVLFDADDKPIAVVNKLITEDLAPGDKIGFEASGWRQPDDVKADNVARYEAFAYPYQYQF